MTKTLIIIPAYNEAESISRVVKTIESIAPQYEYVIINDCSTDTTEKICKEGGYNYINLPVNLGIGGAVQCGYQYALANDYDIVVQFDGDGQHGAEYINELVKPIENGEADMVVGSRFINKEGFQSSFMRRLGILIIKWVIWLCCGAKVTDTTSGFRAVCKPLISHFAKEYANDYPEPEAIVSAVLNGYRVKEVPVKMNERAGGESSINTVRAVYYMIKVPIALAIYRLGAKKVR